MQNKLMKRGQVEIINLDRCVLNALDLYNRITLPKINLNCKNPLIIGSGNALTTGRILFKNNSSAIFADESNFKDKIGNHSFDSCIIISASGGKHAPLIAKEIKKNKTELILLTNNENPLASKYCNKVHVFPKNKEPYTYNTSTYLSMILSKFPENINKISSNLNNAGKKIKSLDLKKYDSFYFIIPEKFELTKEMFSTKFDELFGSKITGRVFTYEQTKHAKTVVPNDKELFISFGCKNKVFGKNKIEIDLYSEIGFAGFISLVYYVIGKIQEKNHSYFGENIENYARTTSKVFGQKINPIVD